MLADKQLLDYDREYLVKELTKLAEHNRSLSYMYSRILKEKNVLEKHLDETKSEIQGKNELVEELHGEIENIRELAMKKDGSSEDMQICFAHCQELIRDNSEKSNIIIALQSKLLSINEGIEMEKKRNEEVLFKNENLMQQVRALTIDCDWQRTQSKRLSEQVDQKSGDNLRKTAEVKRETYRLKFELSRVTEEKDAAVHKLEEFKNVMSALNARHDILQQEKCNEEEKRDQVSQTVTWYRSTCVLSVRWIVMSALNARHDILQQEKYNKEKRDQVRQTVTWYLVARVYYQSGGM